MVYIKTYHKNQMNLKFWPKVRTELLDGYKLPQYQPFPLELKMNFIDICQQAWNSERYSHWLLKHSTLFAVQND